LFKISNENIDYAYNNFDIFYVYTLKFELIKANKDTNYISCDKAKNDAGFPDKNEITPVAAINNPVLIKILICYIC